MDMWQLADLQTSVSDSMLQHHVQANMSSYRTHLKQFHISPFYSEHNADLI